MTHTRVMTEHEGDLGDERECDRPCPACKKTEVVYQIWESSCGGYEDVKYTCVGCGNFWWVDGPDS